MSVAAAVIFVAAALVAAAAAGHAGDVKTVHGVITAVDGNRITVGHRPFDIRGARIQDPSGRSLAVADLSPGLQADVFIRRGRIESIVVYESTLR